MAQTKPKAAQFYGVSGDGTAGQVLISDGNGGMFWGANTENYTVSWNTPTGQGLTYTQPTPQSSSGPPGSAFPTTTFTATKSGEIISGTATIAGLPTGITATQSLSGSGVDNILTVTLAGVFPGGDSLNTNLTISGLTVALPLTVDYLVVAGGGGSGTNFGGGGGAGGLRTSFGSNSGGGSSAENTLTLDASTNYTVTVGGGGGSNGQGANSTFNTITSIGGGKGAGWTQPTSVGGSGGGQGVFNPGTYFLDGAAGTANQGYKGGGYYLNNSASAAGGGGGAAQAGQHGLNPTGGYGGNGLSVGILNATNATTSSVGEVSGSAVYYAGGGGGSAMNPSGSVGGAGGLGGGGNGANDTGGANSTNEAGGTNTGGGAGGGSRYSGQGKGGGSGVVIIRYPNTYTITVGAGITQSSGSPFTEGSNKVSVFTAGTGNIQFN